jgi:hypothetical protein
LEARQLMAGASPAPAFRLGKMTFPAELARSHRPPAPAPEFQLGKTTFSLIGKFAEGDGDLGDPHDLPYEAQLTYKDGTVDYGTVRVDRTDPSMLDVYDSHRFTTPGMNTVQVLLKDGPEPVSGGYGNGGGGYGNGGYGNDSGGYANDTAHVVVRFPSVAEIEADPAVIQAARKLWHDALQVSKQNHAVVQEMGAWIELNTESGKYAFVNWPPGPMSTANFSQIPHIDIPPKPLDTYGYSYVVGTFHTHVAVQFGTPKGWLAPVGPSNDDTTNANNLNLPGLVYDYVGKDYNTTDGIRRGVIVGKTPLNAKATIWNSGPDRRPTPTVP